MYRLRGGLYTGGMPTTWTTTVDAHRRTVRQSILDAVEALVRSRGPLSVTMSNLAEAAGIGRATLYKYFPDVESVMVAWHDRHVSAHLQQLSALAGRSGDAGSRLRAVLDAYAAICHRRGRHGTDVAALVHRGDQVHRAEAQLLALIRDLVAEAAEDGQVRNDVDPRELALFCVHALTAAGMLRRADAVRRLVDLTWAALGPRESSVVPRPLADG